jgi:pimeloyl-ACP methyl ester carboxylesterase
VAADVSSIADALGIERFAVMGHSGGAMHALACSAVMPERVLGTVCVSALAPFQADGLDWFAGMWSGGVAELRAAAEGRAALEHFFAAETFDPEMFTPADRAALAGEWSWLGMIAGKAMPGGVGGMVDDDLAFVAPWEFDPERINSPVLLLHGGQDRIAPPSHARWLARHIRSAELWLRPDDGHVSVLSSGDEALAWLVEHAR